MEASPAPGAFAVRQLSEIPGYSPKTEAVLSAAWALVSAVRNMENLTEDDLKDTANTLDAALTALEKKESN